MMDLVKQLRESEAFFNTLFDHNPDTIYFMDLNGKMLNVNPAGERISGYTLYELSQLSPEQFFSLLKLENTLTYLDQVVEGHPVNYETQLRHRDGHWVDLHVTNAPIIIEGMIVGFLGIAKDITERKRQEELLRKSEQSLAQAQRIAQLGSWDYDMVLNRMYWSDQMYRIYGLSPEQYVPKFPSSLEFVHPEDRVYLQQVCQQALHGKPYSIEYRILRTDGSERHVSAQAEIKFNERGMAVQMIGTLQDITDRRNQQEQLRQSEERYRLISEHSLDIITSHGADGRIEFVSPACRTLLGYEQEEILGGYGRDFVHADDQDTYLRQFGRVGEDDVYRSTFRALHKTGRLVWLETTTNVVRNPLTGEPSGYICVARDVSDRQRAETALRESETKFRLMAENMSDLIAVISQDGTVEYASPSNETTLGLTLEALLGSQSMRLIHPDDRRLVECEFERMLQTRESFLAEFRSRHRDGHWLVFECRAVPVCNEHGDLENVLIVARDISERRKTEEMLLQSEKLSIAGQLAAGVAHEIRNPLTALKGFLQLMQADGHSKADYLKVMLSELNRIELIVSELLVLAKPQMTRFKPTDVRTVLQEVLTLLDTQAILNNIQIHILTDGQDPWIECDQNQMKQVFINFLKNAIEAMPRGGEIRIEVSCPASGDVQLRFLDEGCGISKERIAKIGEPFYTTKDKGTGLGLMVSFKIIQQHGGSVQIESEQDVGTMITLTLPRLAVMERARA
ncbi:PAS domain S-box protein [Tumebacillus permanentifrigoris]|uniref:histidine kinase n=1 Tax=Tumebacillus permanentifrigoris TaxID=378543 RepID=A0A316D336_9BACL|nr:PAS domain S-box protein [Tumebacillus permanentifrigoris]PWK05402.1 two-component system sporulation sensor kinase A [Tumebacillus permanentifrigoris]